MGQDICSRKDEKPLGYDWECGHEELYVRVNMYYNGSLYVGLWQKQKECEKKLELFGDLTILLHVRLHITLNLKSKESLHSGEKNTIVSRNVVSRMA